MAKPKSPNKALEDSIKAALKRIEDDKQTPLDVVVKVLAVAISWEKAKHAIIGGDDGPFDPDEED